jgi:hypothetical protein
VRNEVALVRQLARPVVVIVSRTPGGWRAEIAALGVVRAARTLTTLDRTVRDLLGTNAVDYEFRTGDAELDRLVLHIRAARVAARRSEERARHLTRLALALPSAGTIRDVGLLLGVSHQRVYQLLRRRLSTVEGERAQADR